MAWLRRLLLLLLFPAAAFGQGFRYDNFVIKPLPSGGLTSVSGALITVCTSAGTGTPCIPKVANIYSDEALTVPIVGTGGAGTTNSDSGGNFGFYAAPGSYIITVTGSGITSYTIKVMLPLGIATGISNINGVRWIDGTKFTTCNAAVADLGANPGIVIIPSTYAGAECSVTADNITLWDFRAGSSRVAQGVHYRVNDSSTHIRMLVADVLNASNLTNNQNHAELYGKVNYNGNPTGGSQVVEGVAGLAGTDTAISGNFPGQIIGVEGTGDVAATGGFTVGTVKGGTFNTTLSAGNTNVSQMFSLYAQAPTKIGTGIITQAASFVAEDPCVGACPASSVNLSGWFLGDTRFDKHISQSVAPSASIGHFSRVSNFTGLGQQGMFIAPTFSSGATTEGEAIMARADLVAAAFTQGLNANFYSANPVFGGGATATNHYGYYAEPQTAGVTNYAYYAAGTEASFFGGPVQHGEIAAPSAVAGKDICYGDSTAHALECSYNGGSFGLVPLTTTINSFTGNTASLTADWTCGTTGTVASCVAATIIGSGGGVPLTFTLPLFARSYTLECDGVVGQATAVTANQWNLLTATNGATNVTANYTMATAATAFAAGAVTDQASVTTTFQIAPSWTLGGITTKMPFHIWAKIEGSSASGTVVSLQLVAPTVADLVTIYRGTSCRVF